MRFQSRSVQRAIPAVALLGVLVSACTEGRLVLTEQIKAQRLASGAYLEFSRSNEASNRAVMADTDEASSAAAREAEQASAAAEEALTELRPLLDSLGYTDELAIHEQLVNRFDEFRKLDAEILPLSVENTNLKAQRLAFKEGQKAADELSAATRDLVSSGTSGVALAALRARAAVLEVQVIQTRHIAEADESAMSGFEQRMKDAQASASENLRQLRALAFARSPEIAPSDALNRFRRSTTKSFALAPEQQRDRCTDAWEGNAWWPLSVKTCRALQDAMSRHEFKATKRYGRYAGSGIASAGRWHLIRPPRLPAQPQCCPMVAHRERCDRRPPSYGRADHGREIHPLTAIATSIAAVLAQISSSRLRLPLRSPTCRTGLPLRISRRQHRRQQTFGSGEKQTDERSWRATSHPLV